MEYLYFGFFRNGKDHYVLSTDEKIPIEKFKFSHSHGHINGCLKVNNPIIPSRTICGYVYNLKTESKWDIKRSDNDFIIVDINDTLHRASAEDFLEEEMCLIDYQIIHINSIVNERKYRKDPIVENDQEENYPDLIIGSNITKIKLDKEFNYVGKLNFQPFPKRDNGSLRE